MSFNTIKLGILLLCQKGSDTGSYKWVFSVKYLTDGSIDLYKTHFVAKYFTQISDKDFSAISVPITKFNTICLLVSLATSYSPLHQLDVKNDFLNGDLSETIYMDPLSIFWAQGKYLRNVCIL